MASVTFAPTDIDERKLEFELRNNPNLIEEGLIALDHQVSTARGIIDMLCVDRKGILSIAELKVEEDDTMLMQALDYLDWVKEQVDRLAERYGEKNTGVQIDVGKEPRIILVAPSFSERLMAAVKYVTPTASLFDFEYLETNTGQRGLRLARVSIAPVSSPPRPISVEEHLQYITDESSCSLCKQIVKKIKSIDDSGIELKPRQYYLALQHQGRNIAKVYPRRDFFYIEYLEKDEWVDLEVRKPEDFTDAVFVKINEQYAKLKSV